MNAPQRQRGDRLTIAASALFAAALYASTAAPGLVIEGDCGELVAAARVAGIPHAPGYPTYMLIASTIGAFIEPEHLARALNLMSAFFGALTVALVTALALRIGRELSPTVRPIYRRATALFAGLALAGSVEFWTQSLSTEVYTMSTALVIACTLLLMPASVPLDSKRIPAAAILAGLAFGVHYTAGPVCSLLLIAAFVRSAPSARRAATMVAFFAFGLATFVYLPLRSAANPLLDSADPESLRGFARAVFLLGRPTSGASLGAGVTAALGLVPDYFARLTSQWPDWISALAIVGSIALCVRRARSEFAALVTVFVAISVGSVLMAGFEPSDEPLYEVRFLFLPAHAVACVAAGTGALFLVDLAGRRGPAALAKSSALAISVAPALGLALWIAREYPLQDKSTDTIAIDYAQALLAETPEGAIVFTFGDNAWMLLTYMQLVEVRRPDVTVVHVPLLGRAWYRRVLARRHPDLRIPARARSLTSIAKANADAPLLAANPRARDIPGFRTVPNGLLMRVVPSGASGAAPSIRDAYEVDTQHVARDLRERTLLLYYANSFRLVGDWYAKERRHASAAEAYALGARLTDPEPWFADWGELRALLELGLGRAELARGQRGVAREALQRALELSPQGPTARACRGLLERAGD